MTDDTPTIDTAEALARVDAAAAEKKISAGALENIRHWLSDSRYADYEAQVRWHVERAMWAELDDAFWTIIPFGTGGRRGRMYPIGSNAINDRTIGESAQGLAEYVSEQGGGGELSCAIAFDTRHKSMHFARLCAGILVAGGLKVYLLDEIRSTPELSFLVRYKKCSCGIMVTASHNPPSDNAVKVYWSTGGQLLPPHDRGVIERVMNVQEIQVAEFDQALADGRIDICTAEVDAAFAAALMTQVNPGPRNLKIIYSPLHGVGETAVVPALSGDGFTDVEVFAPHREPNGDFPNVPGHVSNPENPAVFDAMIERAQQTGAELILASDPDCDRIGCAALLTTGDANWRTFTGNQIAALLADYVLETKQAAGGLTPEHYLVKTLVTTEMVRRIGDSYGVRTIGDLLVGFKYIGGVMDEAGPDNFLFGCEESHGYLVGQYARDKDAAVAAMLLCELAAALKAEGKTLCEKLEALYWQHGYHAEQLVNQRMEGSAGMEAMSRLMTRFREEPPRELAGLKVAAVRDYGGGKRIIPGGEDQPLSGPTGDLVMIDLAAEGNYVAVRPSGTEPKVKFYMFTYVAPEQLANLEDAQTEMEARLDQMAADLAEYATG